MTKSKLALLATAPALALGALGKIIFTKAQMMMATMLKTAQSPLSKSTTKKKPVRKLK